GLDRARSAAAPVRPALGRDGRALGHQPDGGAGARAAVRLGGPAHCGGARRSARCRALERQRQPSRAAGQGTGPGRASAGRSARLLPDHQGRLGDVPDHPRGTQTPRGRPDSLDAAGADVRRRRPVRARAGPARRIAGLLRDDHDLVRAGSANAQEHSHPLHQDGRPSGAAPGEYVSHLSPLALAPARRGRGRLPPSGRPGILDLRRIGSLVGDDLRRIEDFIDEQLRSEIPLIAEVGRYLAGAGGKRLRPALLLLSARLSGHRGEPAIVLAAAVELLHAASLRHDDVVDQAASRHHRPSANSRWGNEFSVLFGDLLYTKSIAMALSQDNPRILGLLSDAIGTMVEGEIMEIDRCGDLRVTHEEYLQIVRRKTAVLFSACLGIGGVLGDAEEPRQHALRGYGMNLGICFKIGDALLDFTAKEEVLGKPVASDLREGKLTLPAILTLRRGGRAAREKLELVLEDRGFARVRPDEIVRMARDCGALEETRARAGRYAEAARRALRSFPRSRYREALKTLADSVQTRDH